MHEDDLGSLRRQPRSGGSRRRRVAVIGAGAAGLCAAIHAARAGADVVLLERTGDGGRKILISGGGRCNVLPGTARPERFVTDSSPHTLRRILRAWPLAEQRRFFEAEMGIELRHEPEFDKLFPIADRAQVVRDRLVAAVRGAGGTIGFGARVTRLEPAAGGGWKVGVEGVEAIDVDAAVVATGGLSVPATGSDGDGLRWAERLGHALTPAYPALTPLLADPPIHADLAGVTLDVALRSTGAAALDLEGSFLFTHRGYSGPVVLDASHAATRDPEAREAILVRWGATTPERWEADLQEGAGQLGTLLSERLPTRLARALANEAGVAWDASRARIRREERHRLIECLTRYPLPWTGDEGYRKAEVTGGGVRLDQVHPRSLESRVTPGLYLCGEVLDAFGPIGGHNFMWAWATGRTAGTAAALASERA
ncbi:MAG: aminoacetone oxidase family FAD-binding enzyme [Longimicrobiales bacterium]|nr:aminoacetone oxidase family FAD-binding enzyme [Longimicrobiales bacterium]